MGTTVPDNVSASMTVVGDSRLCSAVVSATFANIRQAGSTFVVHDKGSQFYPHDHPFTSTDFSKIALNISHTLNRIVHGAGFDCCKSRQIYGLWFHKRLFSFLHQFLILHFGVNKAHQNLFCLNGPLTLIWWQPWLKTSSNAETTSRTAPVFLNGVWNLHNGLWTR